MSSTSPFALVSVFTSKRFGGNPAAVAFVDVSLPLEYLGGLSANFNQPMLCCVSPTSLPSDDNKIVVRNIRFVVSNGKEVPICGHGTLAAAKALFEQPEVVASEAHTIHFKNPNGDTLKAVKLEDGFIEIELPSSVPGVLSDEEKTKLKTFVDKAFGRAVVINDIKTGGKVYEPYVLYELDEKERLAASAIDAKALLGNGYMVNIFTSASSNTDEIFVSRMFSPSMLSDPGEDHVCGSAHGVMAPYWYTKRGIPPSHEVKAKQVSKRGGDLRIVWEKEAGRVRLRGQSVVLATGNLEL